MQTVRATRRRSRNNSIQLKFNPSKDQVDALAYRLMPEIKKYFADERIQKEFAEWKENHKLA